MKYQLVLLLWAMLSLGFIGVGALGFIKRYLQRG